MRPDLELTRRELLQHGAAAGALAWTAPALPRSRTLKTRRVVLVAFAGGVRAKEVLGTPANVPNLMRIAGAGVTLPNVWAENSGHYGATLSLFTGHVENLGIRENERGLNPTLFEYLSAHCGIERGEMWLSTAGGAQARLFAHSDHPDYGAGHGAQVLDGDGLLNVEFQRVLRTFGRPRPDDERTRAVLDRLAGALDSSELDALGAARPDPGRTRQVARFVLDELTGGTARLTGPGAGDAKAIRVARSMLRVFRPRVLGITLQAHDIAHGSYNGYVEVIRRNDAELGALWDAIREDPELRDTTTLVVLPEFGRDRDLNERNGLDHGDGSEDLRKVWLVGAGPDFRADAVIGKECRTIDVAPTLYSFFSRRPMPMTKARVLRELFA